MSPVEFRTWYGLRAEVDVEHHFLHVVRVGPFPLVHIPVVNMILRRGLPVRDRQQLSLLHEVGHLQTLPFAFLYLIVLLTGWKGSAAEGSFKSALTLFLAHGAAWELASEAYVLIKSGQSYKERYRRVPNLLGRLLFWGGMTGMATYFASRLFRKG